MQDVQVAVCGLFGGPFLQLGRESVFPFVDMLSTTFKVKLRA